MSLALVTVSGPQFDHVHDHLMLHSPHQNMHLRQTCVRNKKRDLRYLHVMRPVTGATLGIEGAISGPGVLWHYALSRTRGGTQLSIRVEQGSPKALNRIAQRFLIEILTRVSQEKAGFKIPPRRTPGQYYLRRQSPGSAATDPKCFTAVKAGVLDPTFVSLLASWNFVLLQP